MLPCFPCRELKDNRSSQILRFTGIYKAGTREWTKADINTNGIKDENFKKYRRRNQSTKIRK
jgi:hypothetical protein